MKKYRLQTVLLALVLLLSLLTACASGGSQEAVSTSANTAGQSEQSEAAESDEADEAADAEQSPADTDTSEEPAVELTADNMFSDYYKTTKITYETTEIDGVPAIVWGKPADKVILAIQGMFGCKEDAPNVILAEEAEAYGYQVISIDLPGHGVRAENSDWIFTDCAADVRKVLDYATKNYAQVSMHGDSFGAYMILTECEEDALQQRLFISPAVDMLGAYQKWMDGCGITVDQLKAEQVVEADGYLPFRWDNYEFMENHPIKSCPKPTSIMYNENDEIFSKDLVTSFAEQYGCDLTIFEGGEHWVHTPEQLDFYREWVDKVLIH